MKAKIFITAMTLLALLTSAALGAIMPNTNQNIDQSASQTIGGSTINNSTINQGIAQAANQNVMGAGLGSNVNVGQNIDQSANQNIQGSNIVGSSVSQEIAQGATQNAMGNETNASLTSNQNIDQRAAQNIQGSNIFGSSVSQGIAQGAAQTAAGMGANRGFTSSQNIAQDANQSLQGVSLQNASLNQNIIQGANQSFVWNNQSYFTMNNQAITQTASQRAALMPSVNDFLIAFPNNRMFIMPLTDLDEFNAASRRDVTVLNVGFGPIPYRFSSLPLISIPINQLATRIGEIPLGTTIAIIGDNDMASATAATLLRMQGYNAWAVRTGTC